MDDFERDLARRVVLALESIATSLQRMVQPGSVSTDTEPGFSVDPPPPPIRTS